MGGGASRAAGAGAVIPLSTPHEQKYTDAGDRKFWDVLITGKEPVFGFDLETPIVNPRSYMVRGVSIPRIRCRLNEYNNLLYLQLEEEKDTITVIRVEPRSIPIPDLIAEIRKQFEIHGKGFKISIAKDTFKCTIKNTQGKPFRLLNSRSARLADVEANSITDCLGLDPVIDAGGGAYVTQYVGSLPVDCQSPTFVDIHLDYQLEANALGVPTVPQPHTVAPGFTDAPMNIGGPGTIQRISGQLYRHNSESLHDTFGAPWRFIVTFYL